jgi:hypothetical protein
MMNIMMPIPPIHVAAISPALFWGMIGLMVILVVFFTALWIVGNQRIAQQQAQTKETERQYELLQQPQYEEPFHVHSSEEEILLRK